MLIGCFIDYSSPASEDCELSIITSPAKHIWITMLLSKSLWWGAAQWLRKYRRMEVWRHLHLPLELVRGVPRRQHHVCIGGHPI